MATEGAHICKQNFLLTSPHLMIFKTPFNNHAANPYNNSQVKAHEYYPSAEEANLNKHSEEAACASRRSPEPKERFFHSYSHSPCYEHSLRTPFPHKREPPWRCQVCKVIHSSWEPEEEPVSLNGVKVQKTLNKNIHLRTKKNLIILCTCLREKKILLTR